MEFFLFGNDPFGRVGGGDIWEFRVSIFVLKNFIVKIKLEEFFVWQRSIWVGVGGGDIC